VVGGWRGVFSLVGIIVVNDILIRQAVVTLRVDCGFVAVCVAVWRSAVGGG
jgi:hypothetical protein